MHVYMHVCMCVHFWVRLSCVYVFLCLCSYGNNFKSLITELKLIHSGTATEISESQPLLACLTEWYYPANQTLTTRSIIGARRKNEALLSSSYENITANAFEA